MKKWLASVLLVLGMVLCVEATPYQLNINPWVNGQNVSITLDNQTRTVYAGEFSATFVGTPYDGYPQTWETYCTDLNETLWAQGNLWEPVSLTDAVSLNGAATHWSTGGLDTASDVYLSFRDDPGVAGTPLQLAIWQSLYGDRFHINNPSLEQQVGQLIATREDYHETGTWWMPTDSAGTWHRGQGLIGNTVTVPDGGSTLGLLALGLCLPIAAGYRKLRTV